MQEARNGSCHAAIVLGLLLWGLTGFSGETFMAAVAVVAAVIVVADRTFMADDHGGVTGVDRGGVHLDHHFAFLWERLGDISREEDLPRRTVTVVDHGSHEATLMTTLPRA